MRNIIFALCLIIPLSLSASLSFADPSFQDDEMYYSPQTNQGSLMSDDVGHSLYHTPKDPRFHSPNKHSFSVQAQTKTQTHSRNPHGHFTHEGSNTRSSSYQSNGLQNTPVEINGYR